MVTETNTQSNYRYPGIRPFYDNDIDRRLFFGRDTEKEALLHKILADNLVVLYARSGLGKTSLLNAGLSQALRDREFIPLMVRFNDPGLDPVKWIYAGIKEIAKQVSMEVEAGNEATLWQYFKTAYFWSASNKMLTPVLILDQFEEFFTLYSPEERKGFIRQMADVVNDKISASLLESVKPGEPLPYGDNPPNVKIIISIREDYVGQLDEMSREIPDILQHRFRLLPLSREQAGQAIVKPSQVQDDVIGAASFTFAAEAVGAMLDFLCKRMERGKSIMTDEVESFQLQLLCRHIEDMAREKKKKEPGDIIVKKEDLGGEAGMQRVLQRFYDDQVKKLDTLWKRRKARRLCEKGLISVTDLRLSLEEGEIKRKFRISENLLVELVNSRLLRGEPRVGSVYYELSHDTMVAPIRESQRKRESKRIKFDLGVFLLCILILTGFLIERNYRENQKINERRSELEAMLNKFESKVSEIIQYEYLYIGDKNYNEEKFDEAIKNYKIYIVIDPKSTYAYNNMGNALYNLKKYDEAIAAYQKAIEIDPKHAYAYNNMGLALGKLKKYDEAIAAYQKAIEIDPKYANAYYNMGIALRKQEKYDEAIAAYQKAIEVDPKDAETYNNMGLALYNLKKYDEAIAAFQKAIEIDPKNISVKANLAEAYLIAGHFDVAFSRANDLLKEKDISIDDILAMRFITICSLVLQGQQPETANQLKDFIKYYQSLPGEYERRGWEYDGLKTFITRYKKLPPAQKNLLLQIIDLLESPKQEGDKKLKELEIAVQDVFK